MAGVRSRCIHSRHVEGPHVHSRSVGADDTGGCQSRAVPSPWPYVFHEYNEPFMGCRVAQGGTLADASPV